MNNENFEKLKKLWNLSQGTEEKVCLYDILPNELRAKGINKTFLPGGVIVHEGDFPEYVYFIKSGQARGSKLLPSGEKYEYFCVDKHGNGIGTLEVFARKTRIIATVVAEEITETLRLPSYLVYEFAMNNTEYLWESLHDSSCDLYHNSDWYGLSLYKKALDRLQAFLVKYFIQEQRENSRNTLVVKNTYEELASILSVSVRTIGRGVLHLRKEGLIGKKGAHILVNQEQYYKLLQNISTKEDQDAK